MASAILAPRARHQEEDLRGYIQSIVHDWSKTLTALGFTLVPIFFILDYFMMPSDLLPRFALYRLIATLIVVAQYVVLRLTQPGPSSHFHGFFISVVVGGMIALMTTHLGGFNSSYYAGLNLVMIAVNLVLPWKFTYSTVNSLLIICLYVAINLLAPQSEPVDMRIFLNNMYFLSATAVITVAMNYVQHQLIRQEFLLRTDLKAARDALWGEMEIAKRIQTSLLPSVHEFRAYKVAATMLPAEEVGGDYYDIFAADTGETWIAIGDVSGHGVESGLIMMMTQTSIRTTVNRAAGCTPAAALDQVNVVIKQNISRLGVDRYMTLCIMRVDDHAITFAGRHQDILIYRAATGGVETVRTEGSWIGVADDISASTTDRTAKINPGDIVVLYTDGVTEAMNGRGELYGEDRLRHAVARSAHKSVDDIMTSLVRDVQAHMDRQQDDISVVVLRHT